MLLFKLADLPRSVRRLARSLPLGPERTSAPGQTVSWALAPALIDPADTRTRELVSRLLALYAAAEGRSRAALDTLPAQVEDLAGEYRLGRCLARAIEVLGYHFAPPETALAQDAASLRALCYHRAQAAGDGVIPAAERAAFLAGIAADLGVSPAELETALWADRSGTALLTAGRAPHGVPSDGEEPPVTPERVIAAYNAGVVSTVLAAASWVTLRVPAAETTVLKDLYRHARVAHVGVEIAAPGGDAALLDVTLYGPGSRSLVRGRTVQREGASVPPSDEEAGESGDDAPDEALSGAADVPPDQVAVPAPGGAPVAAVVARLVRRHPTAVRGGWARVLGVDRRLFHVGLDTSLIAALRAETTDPTAGEDAAEEDALSYDSAVEENFARAWLAQEAGGRLGVAHGWVLRREPRAIAVDGTVFIPDFTFSRGETEVYAEIVGFYTDDYVARKRHKLAALSGRIRLLLVIEEDLAPLFADVGYPVVTYKSGRAIRMTEVVRILETRFDPFARRKERASAALAALCAVDGGDGGPDMDEATLCERLDCAGPSELAALWAEVVRPGNPQASKTPFVRRYVPGYGLVRQRSLDEATAALQRLLDEAGGPLALDDALACCRAAGIAAPDTGLLLQLHVAVVRDGLFGDARVYRQGDDTTQAQALADAAPVPTDEPATKRPAARRGRRAPTLSDATETQAIGLFATEPASP